MSRKKSQSHNNSSDSSLRDALARAVLGEVAQEGWTRKAYTQGILKAGVSRGEADLLFPQGVLDIIGWLDDLSQLAMISCIEAEPDFASMRVRDKVAMAIRARLEAKAPYREAVKRLVGWYAMPLHAPLAARKVMAASDAVWKAIGDRSTDFSYYTRRVMLAGVIKAVTLFWISDETARSRATWEFLDRRIADVMRFGKTISLLKEWSPAEIVEMVGKKLRRA